MIVVLSRGAFCPKDRRQAEGLIQLHREVEAGYCRLVTISTDNITETNELSYRRRRALAVSIGSWAPCAKGSRHRGIYRSRP